MTDARPHPKGAWTRIAVALVLLFQFFTFSGFSDVAPSRDSRTQSEWIISFSERWKKTISFRRASRRLVFVNEKAKTLFRRRLHRQNNRYLTWLARVCTTYVDEPFTNIPLAVLPRSTTNEYRS